MAKKSSFRPAVLFALFALLGLVLPPSSASADDAIKGIVATGSGEVRVRPDSVRVTIGVEAQGKTVEEVERRANQKMTQVLQSLRALEIPNLQMQTSILAVRPIYATTPAGVRTARIVGYTAVNGVSVEVRKAPFDNIAGFSSAIMSAALKTGANLTGDFELFLDDPSMARGQALDNAVKEARRKGEVMAKSAGITITGVALVREAGAILPIFEGGAMAMLAEGAPGRAAPATPVEAGEITVSTNVTVWLTVR